MAEIVLSAFLSMVFEKLASTAIKKLTQSTKIHSELKKWERSLSNIQDLLNDASQKEITNKAVKRWLNSLQHLAYDIDDILDELATEAMHLELTTEQSGAIRNKVRKLIPTCCTSFSSNTIIYDKLSGISAKLQDLEKEKVSFGLIVKNGKRKEMKRIYETSLPDESSVIGREFDTKELVHMLLYEPCDRNFSIVPIVGMGGIGKTTIARTLYNETQVNDHFELKAWVCVSDEFDVFKISNAIFQSMTGEDREFADLNMLQVAIKEKVLGKRFLLVLDDVWSDSYDDWVTLVRPFHVVASKSKIIITSRKQQLLKQLGYDHPYHLQTLSNDEALCLFSHHALGTSNFDLYPTLKPYGDGIVEKCNGLPLALVALGRLLRTKKDEEDWNDVLNSEIWRLDDVIVPALRLSYHDLSASLKQLFAYCSLFPKDYMFDKEDLILLWMAEGFLHQSTLTNSTEERLGHTYFEELLSRSFFQHAPNEKSLYMMHDLMNDLAISVAGDFFLRLDNEREKDLRKKTLEKYRHISFVREKYGDYNKFKAIESYKSLRTFLALSVGVKEMWQKHYMPNKILVELLPRLPLLRVLSLSDYQITEVPESIGSLKHIRYLNLSRTRITCLPDNVCNLYNLQTLILFGCRRLSKLPNNFLNLKKLRHFDIRDTPLLKKMPLGMGELKSLQTLSKIIIGGNNGFPITKLKDFKNLRGEVAINGLDKVQNLMHAREAYFSQKRLTELELEWSNVFDDSRNETLEYDVLNVMKPHNDTLKMLKLVSYGGTEFPKWVGDPLFLRLTQVTLRGCEKCTSLPPLGQLPSLKQLSVHGMHKVKVVGSDLLGTSLAFPSLEVLSFYDMQGWAVWSTNSGVVFPCLQELFIRNCPNLVEVTIEAFPSLRVLEVKKCGFGVLTSLVQVASLVTVLEIESVFGLTNELWEGVMEHLREVEEVRIEECNELRYLWKSEVEASKVLVNIRKLEVWNCKSLASLGEKEENNGVSSLTSLRMLEVWCCKSMKSCSCSSNIEKLKIDSCSSITSISLPKGGQKLKSLVVRDCKELMDNELIGEKMAMLEYVSIRGWPNLKSIKELSYFIHITELTIQDCSSMESFIDAVFPSLISLTHMAITDCPNMDASFPRGIWPPKLCSLVIGRLKKPITQWGTQNFPTSLVYLSLLGGSTEDDVSSCSQLSHLFPSSLTSLRIHKFENLGTISMGLEHLTSLQYLSINDCQKVKDLPQMLFSLLLSLQIYGCPNLTKSCSRRGSYWPLISHIPDVLIDGHFLH